MSLFKKVTSRPAFGVVGAPPSAPVAPAQPAVNLAAYGLSESIDATRPGPTPVLDEVRRLFPSGDWRPIAALLRQLPVVSDVRIQAIDVLGELSVDNDGWLRQWLAAKPDDATALSVYSRSLVNLAWQIRTTKMPEHISRDQWDGFFRVLRQVPDVCNRAASLDQADPAPLAALLAVAKGLQWKHDDYRALYAELMRRAPGSYIVNSWASSYWLPRWFGSKELLVDFVDTAIASAPVGSLLTTLRLDALYFELRPDEKAERQEYYKSAAVNAAIDASLADLAAADPAHPMLPHLRHWLAYWLYLNDRSAEAIVQFQAIGDYCGARPWTAFSDFRNFFNKARMRNIAEYEASQQQPSQ